jgi:aspartyl protease family protein
MNSDVRCHRHPDAPSCGVCVECAREICDACAIPVEVTRIACPPCARQRTVRAARNRFVLAALGVLALFVVASAVVYGRAQRSTTSAPSTSASASASAFDYDALGDGIPALHASLTKEPCDRAKIVQLGERLVRAGEPRESLRRAAAFFKQCGDYPRLLWVTYGAHKQLSEWDAAIADASKLIELEPDDKDYWGWRGQVYEAKGDLDHAIRDYRQTIAIAPAIGTIPFNLASLYERSKRPCEGIFPIEQFVHYHPEAIGQVRHRLERLYALEECAPIAGTGHATLELQPGTAAIRAAVSIDGKPAGIFLVDTGASFVALSETVASRLGIVTTGWERIRVQTAGGVQSATLGALDSVELQGLRANQVAAAVVEDLGAIDGLLGLSFLSRFEMHVDPAKGRIELTARKKPAERE